MSTHKAGIRRFVFTAIFGLFGIGGMAVCAEIDHAKN